MNLLEKVRLAFIKGIKTYTGIVPENKKLKDKLWESY